MGCCTSLLYETTLASKDTVKIMLTSGDLGGAPLNFKYTFETFVIGSSTSPAGSPPTSGSWRAR